MPLNIQAKINQHFHDELIKTLAHQTGLPPEKLRVSIHFSILAAVYQMNFRLQQPQSLLVTYRMAKVSAGAEVSRHLSALFNKQVHYQGIINMASVLYNGDFPKLEKMLQERFGLSEDISHRILIMCTCATISMLGESIREKKLRPEGFREMLQIKLPLFTEELSSGLNFPFDHWEVKSAETRNQQFRSQNRRKRSAEKKSRFSLPFKWLFILILSVGILSAVYAYA